MFRHKRQKPPDAPFEHVSGCRLLRTDPDFQPEWQEVDTGRWRRECQCGAEGWTAPYVDDRVRVDPYDTRDDRHIGACEFAHETDPDKLGYLLKVQNGAGDDYHWVTCGACDCSWQVPFFAESGG